MTDITLKLVPSIDSISARDWDSCLAEAHPFVRHDWIKALEISGSACADTGWYPQHLVARRGNQVVGVAPLYLKTHSYGEYVFDWAWADAWQKAGRSYYPKLQNAVPFTPVTGPRLLTADRHVGDVLAQGLVLAARQWNVDSVHSTFCQDTDKPSLCGQGFLARLGFQYQWTNRGYGCFQDFLNDLSSRKRKQIRRERLAVQQPGLVIRTLVGNDVKAHHWDQFHQFYRRVVDHKWGSAYLTRAFFEHLSQSPLGQDVVLIWAEQDGQAVAGAFNMLGGPVLYGRTWGTGRDVPFLHFEACYYRALDFAIAHGLKRVEAGAQGDHKLSRGYVPVPTWSAHWIGPDSMRGLIARFLDAEQVKIRQIMAELENDAPFHHSI